MVFVCSALRSCTFPRQERIAGVACILHSRVDANMSSSSEEEEEVYSSSSEEHEVYLSSSEEDEKICISSSDECDISLQESGIQGTMASPSKKRGRSTEPSSTVEPCAKKCNISTEAAFITDYMPLDLWLIVCNHIYTGEKHLDLTQALCLLQFTVDPHQAIEMFYHQRCQPTLAVLCPQTTRNLHGGHELITAVPVKSAIVSHRTHTMHTQPDKYVLKKESTHLDVIIPVATPVLDILIVSPRTRLYENTEIFKHAKHISSSADIFALTEYIQQNETAKYCYFNASELPPNQISGIWDTLKDHELHVCTHSAERMLFVAPRNTSSIEQIFDHSTILSIYKISPQTRRIEANAFKYSKLTNIDLQHSNVTVIGENAFKNCKDFKMNVVLPPKLKMVPSHCFCNSAITGMVCNDTLYSIGEYAVYNTNITKIVLSATVIYLGYYAFAKNEILTDVDLTHANGLNTIPNHAFRDCVALKIVLLSDKIEIIGDCAFKDCKSLHTCRFIRGGSRSTGTYFGARQPSVGNLTIGNSAFAGCGSLLYIPWLGRYTLKMSAFEGCRNLKTDFVLGGFNQPDLPDRIFMGCESLTNVLLQDGTQSIGAYMCAGCTTLNSIEFPKSLHTIHDNAFEKCTQIRTVSLEKTFSALGASAFMGCTQLIQVQFHSSKVHFGTSAFSGCSNIRILSLPENTTELPDSFLYGCTLLWKVSNTWNIRRLGKAALMHTHVSNISELVYTVQYMGPSCLWGTHLVDLNLSTALMIELFENTFKDMVQLEVLVLPTGVVRLGDSLCAGCTSLKELVFPPNIQYIPTSCCENCTGLQTVTVSATTNCTIGGRAFARCSALTSFKDMDAPDGCMVFAKKYTRISTAAFEFCSGIRTITVVSEHTQFDDSVFKGCLYLQTVIWAPCTIPPWCFQDCCQLQTLNFSEGCEFIGPGAFENCVLLESVTVNDNTKTSVMVGRTAVFKNCITLHTLPACWYFKRIFDYCFYKCVALKAIRLEKCLYVEEGAFQGAGLVSAHMPMILTIADCAFMECAALTTVSFSADIQTIGAYAFLCTGLVQLHLPPVTCGEYCFANCTNLCTVIFCTDMQDRPLITIGCSAFRECQKLSTCIFPARVVCIGSHAFRGCTALLAMAIPPSVTTIGKSAFEFCTSLNSLTFGINIPQKLEIQESAFKTCSALEQVIFTHNTVTVKNGGFFNCGNLYTICFKSQTKIELERESFAQCGKLVNLDFGSGTNTVLSIGSCAFSGNKALKQLTKWTPNVTSIGEDAFSACTALHTVVLPTSSKYRIVRKGTFKNCTALESINIPPNIEFIENNAFSTVKEISFDRPTENRCLHVSDIAFNAVGVKKITYNEGVVETSTGYWAALESIKFPTTLSKVARISSLRCSRLTKIDLGQALHAYVIETNTFHDMRSLEHVVLPPHIQRIDSAAFSKCYNLHTVENLDQVLYIGPHAFYKTGMVTVTFKTKLLSIGHNAFENCASLTTVDCKAAIACSVIESQAFLDCTNLKTVRLPPKMENITRGLCKNCTSLKQVLLPLKITDFDATAFKGCILDRFITNGKYISKPLQYFKTHAFPQYFFARTSTYRPPRDLLLSDWEKTLYTSKGVFKYGPIV